MSQPLRIAHLYPDLLNLYADKGNILTLVRRLQWRGVDVDVIDVPSGNEPRLQDYDLVLLGGGSDREQELVGRTLRQQRGEWQAAVNAGLPLLAVCGGYQLLGQYYQLPDGTRVPGLELLDLETLAGSPRLIGNIAIDTVDLGPIVGFENHGGRTTHRHMPLGQVTSGHGNNGEDAQEGVRDKHIIGTYIHGPLLPKNPRLADHVLQLALDYAGCKVDLAPLEDDLELAAQAAFLERRIKVQS